MKVEWWKPTLEELLDANACSEDCEHCDRYEECFGDEEEEDEGKTI